MNNKKLLIVRSAALVAQFQELFGPDWEVVAPQACLEGKGVYGTVVVCNVVQSDAFYRWMDFTVRPRTSRVIWL